MTAPAWRRLVGSVAPGLTLVLAAVVLALPTPAQVLPGSGECEYEPGSSCCQCVYGEGVCYEDPGHGGVTECTEAVCPLSGQFKCCDPGDPCPPE
jgi:hypothetical protein